MSFMRCKIRLSFRRYYLKLVLTSVLLVTAYAQGAEKISFNEEIRPIFNKSCVGCHGGVKKTADVSFIYREEALGVSANGKRVIVPGDPENSEVVKRISSDDPRYVMPPALGDHPHAPLKQKEIELVVEWIRQGAEWEEHWAYIQPVNTEVSPKQKDWIRQPMDAYVLDRLENNDLKPTEEAPREQWLRRVSFDLVGLPPSSEELKLFLADEAPDAYEKVVDRLLASPRYGERWAAMWMDIARYADTQGYEKDNARIIWPYRDWLINAFNNNMPYTQFVEDQLAGDLAEKPTTDQLMATGFLRLTQTNTEGGTNDEEFRVEAVKDRIHTSWVAFQGITFSCVQCHSHPYEPIPHADYYKFMEIFNSTEDCDLDNDYPKHLLANKVEERQKVTDAQLKIRELKVKVNEPGRLQLDNPEGWVAPNYPLLNISHGKLNQKDGVLFTSGSQPVHVNYTVGMKADKPMNLTAVKISILPDHDDPAKAPFRGAMITLMDMYKVDAAGKKHPIKMQALYADSIVGQHVPALNHGNGRVHNIGGYPKLFKKREAVLVVKEPLVLAANEHIEATIQCKHATTGSQGTSLRHFQFHLTESTRWFGLQNSEEQKQYAAELNENTQIVKGVKGAEVPVVLERPEEAHRETRLFVGGNWMNKGDVQGPGVPEVLNAYGAKPKDRLDVAQWMTHEENSLAGRVFVNRLFSELFGYGIVETLGDFGATGLEPTNLPLLDYLAIVFRDKYQWQMKPLLKEMVLSATYKQDHKASPEMEAHDPKNLLLARGPRTRLTAEMIRDNALAVSGLLAHRMGGPSVMPPQPDGVWQAAYGGGKWKEAKGPDRYRRALYTYWKRTAPYPSLLTFDAPSRDVCNIRRITTNTPLQPLVTLNDPVFLECAQKIAEGLHADSDEALLKKIAASYRVITQEKVSEATLGVLKQTYDELCETYQNTSFGKLAKTPEEAALVNVASIMLNIDKTITK